MGPELITNNWSSTLNGGINNSVTTVVVNSVPPADLTVVGGVWRLIVDSEIMLVTNWSGATLTVVRGAEGSIASTHSNAAPATHILTRDSVKRVARKNVEPIDTNFSWLNQGGASYTLEDEGLFLLAPAVSGNQLRCLIENAPTPPYNLDIFFVPYFLGDFNQAGIVLYESGTGKLETLQLVSGSGNTDLAVDKWNSVSSFNAFRFTYHLGQLGNVIPFLRVNNDGANINYGMSPDGVHFRPVIGGVALTNFFTVGPDKIGIYSNAASSTNDSGGYFKHYQKS